MSLDTLQQTLGITFTDKELLTLAFVHRSHLNERKAMHTSNERLEFLGDAILSFLTSQYLYETYPQYPEGTLTNIRSALVKTSTLAEIAQSLNLGELLLLSRGEESSGGRTNPSLLADVFEALLGAIFLDQGIDACRTMLRKFLFPKAEDVIQSKSYVDFKSLLQEIIQQDKRVSPTYTVTKSEGPDHARTFWINAQIENTVLGSGTGRSKQEAEQAAAQNALEKMGKI